MSAKESLARAQLAIESGSALFREGLVGECHAHMALALRSLLDAWAPADAPQSDGATTPSEPREQALLRLERSKYRHIVRLSAAYRAVAGEAPRAAHPGAALGERDFDWIWSEVDRLNRFSNRHFVEAETRRFRRRLALGLVPVALIAAILFSWLRGRTGTLASGSYGDVYPPAHALDKVQSTEWLLPDNANGWIELTFKSPRDVHSVTLVNCHNAAYMDRSSGKVRVTAFTYSEIAATVEGEFTKISSERAALDLPLEGKDVIRVRVEVLSHFGLGGGFAEVEVH